MTTTRDIENARLRSSDDLCRLAELIGYRGPVDQLCCKNGAYVSSLLAFFDDNPGAMEAVQEFILEHAEAYGVGEEEEEETDEEQEERRRIDANTAEHLENLANKYDR